MSDEVKSIILELNTKFYDALVKNDLELMESIWLNNEKAKCVHPGWPMLYGWEAVKESWKTIFESESPTEVSLSDVNIQIIDNIAWIICIEKISHKVGNELQTGYAQSTNLFELAEDSWQMVLHHASPVPVPRGEIESDHTLQ